MTVIAWDGKTLASDKQATNHGLKFKTTKIRKANDGSLLFSSGSMSVVESMCHWYNNGADPELFPKHQDDKEDRGHLYVIKPDKKIWRYEFTPYPFSVEEEKIACGCGRDYALAVMYMGGDAIKAVEVASHFDTECGLGVDVLTLE